MQADIPVPRSPDTKMEAEASPSSPVAVNDGAEDVVEEELVASDAYQTHLVEGDFFPAEAPAVEDDPAATDGADDAEDATVDALTAEAAVAVAAVASASASSTQAEPVTPPSRKRVRWADDHDRAAHALVKHVTTFYMPHSSHSFRHDGASVSSPTRPSYAAAVNPAPSIFRDKVDANGLAYKFCKAQRPALRFVEWKRQHHDYGATPFAEQPAADTPADAVSAAPPQRTLFGALFQRSVVARLAEGQVRVRTATQHTSHADSLQLPFIRADAAIDEPLAIPLPR